MTIHCPDPQSNPPDLIVRSGRESLPLEDRIALMEANCVQLEADAGRNPNWRGAACGILFSEWDRQDHTDHGSKAHAFNSMLGRLRGLTQTYRKEIGIREGWLSRYECEILAWRRGGFFEWRQIRHEADQRP
jgi:hypothetical protein